MPKHGDFQYSAACLSVICESFLLNWIIVECCLILNKNVYMNMNYSYPHTMYKFLVENIIYNFHLILVAVDLTRSISNNYCMNSNIPFIHCSKKNCSQC